MPLNYIHDRPKEAEEQIKALLAVRRFRYTRIAVLSPGCPVIFPDNYWAGAKRLEIPEF